MLKKYSKYILSLLLIGVTIAGFSVLQAQKKTLDISTSNSSIENLEELNSVLNLQTVLRSIATNITPGVVSIDIEGTQSVPSNVNGDPFFQFFFGERENLRHQYNSVGSGFIITPDGYLFSNWHVVQDATAIRVTLADGRSFDAKLIGADTELDIALLKIEGTDLPVVPIGNSDETQVGDLVVAIGNPFGLSSTFTFGAVSGLGREGILPGLQRFIQSDVAVNPGNSGGPLLNIKGQAIGINTAIRSQGGGYEGISFAIPINVARSIADQLFTTGTIERGFLGVVPQALDAISRQSIGLKADEGVLVSSLENRGPAFDAGIKQGDIITKVDGEIVNSPSHLTELIAGKNPKQSVEIEVLRNNTRHIIIVSLGLRPSALVRAENTTDPEETENPSSSVSFKGILFGTPSPNDFRSNGATEGVVVKKIDVNSPFSFIFSQGDIVVAVNNTPIPNVETLKVFLEEQQDKRQFAFAIYKNGYLIYRSIEY